MLKDLPEIILRSYRHWIGRELVPAVGKSAEERVKALFEASRVVAASNDDPDPMLIYGNRKALELWEMTPEEFTRTLGRKTAEPMEQAARDRFLAEVRKNGFVENYEGIRISSTGRRFRIEKATVWNLLDEAGRYRGQAATFDHWEDLP